MTDKERETTQEILIDIAITEEMPKGAISDQISETRCYQAIVECIEQFALESSCNLIEHFAYTLRQKLMHTFQIANLFIRVTKMPVISGKACSVSFELGSIAK